MAGPALARLLRRRLLRAALMANLSGAAAVAVVLFAFFFADAPDEDVLHLDLSTLLIASYLLVAVAFATAWRNRRGDALWGWLSQERAPEPRERDLLLREPFVATMAPAGIWAGAAILLFVVELVEYSLHTAFDVALTVVLGGLTTCAVTFLLAERALRPATARALTARPREEPLGPGVSARLIVIWLLATGVPVLALGLLGAVALWLDEFTRSEIATLVLGLSGVAFTAGLFATALVAGSLGHSVATVRRALGRVRRGELDAQVDVDDAGEVGLLQAGFNEMAAGLRDRERVRDLFGRHVGEEVARAALEQGTELGGEVREIAALFVDVEGSTQLAASRPPQEVVAVLNRFFAVVVEVVAAHGGWVNKFEGDAALCVFGAPDEHPDYASRALAAARTLRARLSADVPEIEAGVGVSAGPAVAGNVGAERRYEYTVIGDPVNEAARLCELAKQRQAGALASGEILARASPAEAARWSVSDSAVLRGRPTATSLAAPIGA